MSFHTWNCCFRTNFVPQVLQNLVATITTVTGENCSTKNSEASFLTFSIRCCNGHSNSLGHQATFLKYFRHCNVQPIVNVSVAQSHVTWQCHVQLKLFLSSGSNGILNISQWIFYECLIQNQLGKSYTVRTYAKMMVEDMRPPEKSAILKILSRSKKCRRAKGSPVIGTSFIQHAWESFFVAELQVFSQVLKP